MPNHNLMRQDWGTSMYVVLNFCGAYKLCQVCDPGRTMRQEQYQYTRAIITTGVPLCARASAHCAHASSYQYQDIFWMPCTHDKAKGARTHARTTGEKIGVHIV